MLIQVKNKETLIIGDFKIQCCLGKNGTKYNKIENDGFTPRGEFSLGKLYWRKDRVSKLKTKLVSRVIKKKMFWCNDSKSKHYNKETMYNKKFTFEKLYRNDYKYDYFIVINYNTKNIKKGKGSAIFLHLTKNYNKTAGCIAVKKKDFIIISKLITKNSKILIY